MAKWQVYKRVINKTYLITIVTVFIYLKGNSQFLIWPQEKQRADFYHTLLPQTKADRFQFLVLRDNNFSTTYREKHQILTYDLNGNFLDSINLPKGFVPISFPSKINGSYYWSSLYIDTTVASPNTQDAYLLKFDSLFNCVSKKKISNLFNTSEYPSNVIEINNKLYVSVRNNNNFKLYKMDTLLNKVDSLFQSGLHLISELQPTKDKNILIAGEGFPSPQMSGSQKIIIDTMLHISNVFTLDSLTYVTAGSSALTGCSSQININPDFFKIIPITPTKNYITGHTSVIYDSICNYRKSMIHSIIGNNNKILNTVLINDMFRDVRYADNTNFVYYNQRHLFTVGSEGYNGWFVGNNNTSILITKSDTMANLIWKKSYGNDMFYRPVSIIQTLDSGFLISGIRYDYQNTAYTGVAQGFILRLDKNGDMISTGIKDEANKNYSSFKCYPNPSKDFIKIDVSFVNEYEVHVYNVLGELLMQEKKFKNLNSIDTQALSPGTYILKIKTKDTWLNGKFIKE
jgi:hypothetical protein